MTRRGTNLKLITNSKNLVDEITGNNQFEETEKLKDMPLTSPHGKEALATEKGVDLTAIEDESDYDKLNNII